MPKPKLFHVERHLALQSRLPMWVVFRPNTADFDGMWAARMRITLPEDVPTSLLIIGSSLDQVRSQLPPGVTNIGRQPEDDPVIEEVWV